MLHKPLLPNFQPLKRINSNRTFTMSKNPFDSPFYLPWVDPKTGENHAREGYQGPGTAVLVNNKVPLFSPIQIRDLKLKNRIVVSPM